MLTQERLKELLHYDPETGIFVWRVTTSNIVADSVAGNLSLGYRRIRIDNICYRANRLAFLYMDGYFPEYLADHINGVIDDDRWCNLRHASHSCNMQNRKISRNNTSGFIGVSWDKRKRKWHSRIQINRKTIHFGYHDDIIESVLERIVFEDWCDLWTCNSQDHNRRNLIELGYIK